MSPSTICQGESTRVSYEVENIGAKDQNNVRVQLKSSSLDLNVVTDRIELEDKESRDNDYQGDFVINTKDSTKAGKYAGELIVYYRDEDRNDATLFERFEVIVQDCDGSDDAAQAGSDNQEPATQQPVVVIQQPVEPVVIEPTPTQTAVTATVSKKGTTTPWAIAGLVIVILVILTLIGIIVAILRK